MLNLNLLWSTILITGHTLINTSGLLKCIAKSVVHVTFPSEFVNTVTDPLHSNSGCLIVQQSLLNVKSSRNQFIAFESVTNNGTYLPHEIIIQ